MRRLLISLGIALCAMGIALANPTREGQDAGPPLGRREAQDGVPVSGIVAERRGLQLRARVRGKPEREQRREEDGPGHASRL